MGSVKDLVVMTPSYENRTGLATFIFSDRYSIFDWGKMPDDITDKGASLAVMSAFNFERLQEHNIKTHYRGLVNNSGTLIGTDDIEEHSNGFNIMQVDMALVYPPMVRRFIKDDIREPQYDYSFFENNRGKLNNYLVGLEVIFRNALPEGSSVFRKIEKAKEIEDNLQREIALSKIYSSLGLDHEPQVGEQLPKPIMNFTTKLEASDRVLSESEAYRISGLTQEQFTELKQIAFKVNDIITAQCEQAGMIHYDGKIEFVYNDGLSVCDVLGTFDENRFGINNVQISKEILRKWYKKHQPEFFEACDRCKTTGHGWQSRCEVKPVHIDEAFLEKVSQLYKAGCNKYIQKQVFDVPQLEEILKEIDNI